MADNDYVCTLDEAGLKVAMEELNEDPKERLGQVETFRKWIKEQKHIKAPTDTRYLLKYLRTAKFSQLRAREILEGHLKVKTKYPEWLNDVDMADPKIVDYLQSGHNVSLPKRLPNGRFLIIQDSAKFDIERLDRTSVIRAMFALSPYYLWDENVSVHGIEFFQDFTAFQMKHMTWWGMETMKKTTKLWQGNFPGRFKAFHYYNPGPVFETIMAVAKPVLKKKFQDRMIVHGKNMEDVYKMIPREYLPTDYLPDDYKGPSQGSIKDITENMVKELTTSPIRDRILYETSSEWYYDFALKPEDVPSESFRKLNVD